MKKHIVLLTSIFIYCACGCASTPTSDEFKGDGYIDVMPEKTEDGNIFHAFCWKYKDITENISTIAEQGFKSVQISPVQQPKNGGATWWSFYQPLSFSIADNSSLCIKQ